MRARRPHLSTLVYLPAPTAEVDRLLDINFKGVFFSYKYAAIQLIKQGTGGRIVGAASIASKKGPPLPSLPSIAPCTARAQPDLSSTDGQLRRVRAARAVLRDEVRGAGPDAVRGAGLWEVRDHGERVRAWDHRDAPP